jgi:RimJ/RimL family protein N-acetyltransferase
MRIESPRLELFEVTPELAQANLDDMQEVARLLNAAIPETWPPEHWEPTAIQWLIDKARACPNDRGWFAWQAVLKSDAAATWSRRATGRTLIGGCGVKGPPDANGIIEVGYGIVSEFQRQGFATEAASALIGWTLRDPRVKRIDAETFPNLVPSLGVMRRLGMTSLGAGSEEGTVRYGVTREAWKQAQSAADTSRQP